jgi:hypothetical protein
MVKLNSLEACLALSLEESESVKSVEGTILSGERAKSFKVHKVGVTKPRFLQVNYQAILQVKKIVI